MRICKNDITDTIREHFGANPLKIPESRIQPLILLEIKSNRMDFLGSFKHLIKGGMPVDVTPKNSKVPDVSGVKTKKVSANFGAKILDNFLKAFKMDPVAINAATKHAKTMSFSFKEVNRLYIEPLELGKVLSEHQVKGDQNNMFVKRIIDDGKLRLALITDALVSKTFSLSTYGENDTGADIEMPLLEGLIADLEAGFKVEKTAKNEITFTGEEALTFAFSCVEIIVDRKTGQFSRGDWLKKVRSAKGMDALDEIEVSDEEWNKNAKWLIDSDQANPLLLEF